VLFTVPGNKINEYPPFSHKNTVSAYGKRIQKRPGRDFGAEEAAHGEEAGYFFRFFSSLCLGEFLPLPRTTRIK
jgi:hypothetical protein